MILLLFRPLCADVCSTSRRLGQEYRSTRRLFARELAFTRLEAMQCVAQDLAQHVPFVASELCHSLGDANLCYVPQCPNDDGS